MKDTNATSKTSSGKTPAKGRKVPDIIHARYLDISHVINSDGSQRGRAVGLRPCQLTGCNGEQVGVRWPDGKLTWCCLAGLVPSGEPNVHRIPMTKADIEAATVVAKQQKPKLAGYPSLEQLFSLNVGDIFKSANVSWIVYREDTRPVEQGYCHEIRVCPLTAYADGMQIRSTGWTLMRFSDAQKNLLEGTYYVEKVGQVFDNLRGAAQFRNYTGSVFNEFFGTMEMIAHSNPGEFESAVKSLLYNIGRPVK